MKALNKFFFVLTIACTCGVLSSQAQIFIRVRPERPHYVRSVSPGPRHVWIDEDWEMRDNKYVFVGGRWSEPKRAEQKWIPGHWRQRSQGWEWKPGHWK